jgi:hypothetical protein
MYKGTSTRRLSFSIVSTLLAAFVIPAFAQTQRHDLFVNRDGKAVIERTFPTLAECDGAARATDESKQVSGVGCKPSTPDPRWVEEAQRAEQYQNFEEKRQKLQERVDHLADLCDKLAAQGWRAPEYKGGQIMDGSRFKGECARAWREREVGVSR